MLFKVVIINLLFCGILANAQTIEDNFVDATDEVHFKMTLFQDWRDLSTNKNPSSSVLLEYYLEYYPEYSKRTDEDGFIERSFQSWNNVINHIVDELLKYAKLVIRDENLDRVQVPVLYQDFIGPFGVKGSFLAQNGSAGYLSTVRRTGDATLVHGWTKTTLNLDLGLAELVIDYDNYKAQFLSLGPTGRMRAIIGSNSVFISISLSYNFRNCSEDVNALVMDKFDDIEVKLTGLDPLNWLLDDIATWVARDFRDNIKYLIEDNLRQALQTAMKTYNICKYLPHLHTHKQQHNYHLNSRVV